MITLINRKNVTYNFNLKKEYKGIGRTLCILLKSRIEVPDKVAEEKEIISAIAKGIITIAVEKKEEKVMSADKKEKITEKTKKTMFGKDKKEKEENEIPKFKMED